MSNAAITAKGLYRSYTVGAKHVEVLRGIDLVINQTERVFLCGPSGAGKTTLMYTLAGLERPERGEVYVQGQNLFALSRRKQALLRNTQMSYIFQNYFLLPELTAVENVMVPSLIGGKRQYKEALDCLQRVGLDHRADHLPAELSGGEQQRVAIARALINRPAIIFADEPTGNLDSKNGSTVMNMLLELTKQDDTTLIVVTHDESLAKLGDRKLVIRDGVI